MVRSRFINRVLGRGEKVEKEVLLDCLLEVTEERDLLNVIFDSISEAVLVFDERENLRFANRNAGEWLEFEPAGCLRKPMRSFLHHHEVTDPIRKSLLNGEPVEGLEIAVLTKRPRAVRMNLLPLNDQEGRFGGVLVFLFDVTEEKKRLIQAQETKWLSSLNTFSASLAHEIRNPLNSMGIHAQLMRRKLAKDGDPEMIRSVDIIQEEIRNLNDKLTGFLEAARPRKPQFESISIHKLIKETLKLVGPELEEAGIEPEYYPPTVHTTVFADRVDLRRAFVNILRNAIEAMKKGGRLIIRGHTEGSRVLLSFEDTGKGIPEEDLQKIFELGYSTKDTGSGLGLAQVERCIREHFGKIEVESQEGKGTIIRIDLPVLTQGRRLLEMAPPLESIGLSAAASHD
ncbi:MAG: PAS domain-containing protein [Candidatus Omnitrophica bacterium]|nr:PAS domain-containing protein [Candidatus Omnitrophota bacterium]MCA9445785.1 PAS domain-containing protein [Candidatus Omnitrophota bacterium]MCB9783495.1 PAS domain-containing protein [Candidatus Omnitrophota bacterium]